MLRDTLERISRDFPSASREAIGGHPIAEFLRNDAASEVRNAIARPDLIVSGSPGQGNWADVPWIGVFNPEITTSATHGYYIVILFATDMRSVKLCLGQGVTAIREEFGRNAKDEMLRRAALARDRVPTYAERFRPGPVAFGGVTPLSKNYDHAVAFFNSYDTKNLPDEDALASDLRAMVGLYDLLVSRGGLDSVEGSLTAAVDQEALATLGSIEERRKYVRHNRIDRQSGAAKKAKKIHGYVCQACGFDFAAVYGELGKNYIEAHHLIPLSTLPEGKPVSMDPKTDFAVLCSNCHRMIHRTKDAISIKELRDLIQLA